MLIPHNVCTQCHVTEPPTYGCPKNVDTANTMTGFGYCYELVRRNESWRVSKADCESKNGTMLTIQNQTEQDFVYNMLQTLGYYSVIWLGLHDSAGEEQWYWVTGM